MTTLTPERIEEIRKRLEAIDGAPWEYEAKYGQKVFGRSPGGCNLEVSDYTVADIRGWGHLQYRGKERGDKMAQALQDANGEFIGNAPQDISDLLSAYDALSRDGMREALAWISKIATAEYERDEKLRADGARTLKRIAEKADAALSDAPRQKEG